MQSASNPVQPTREQKPGVRLTFVIEPEAWWRVFFRNVADVFRSSPPAPRMTVAPGEYWEDALVHRPVAWGAMGQSFLGHVLVAVAIYAITLSWLNRPHVVDDSRSARPVENIVLSDYLPAVNSRPEEKPQPARRRRPQQADPELARQEIVSIQDKPTTIRQTIVNPAVPKILTQEVPLPNMVAWTPIPSAPLASHHSISFPLLANPVVPPPEDVAKRNLNAMALPQDQPEAVRPAETPLAHSTAAMNLPQEAQAAVPPSPTPAQRPLGDINLALEKPSVEAPQLPVPQQQAANGQAQESPAGGAVPPAQPIVAGTGQGQAKEAGQLLVLSAQPVAPDGPMTVPEGNLKGEFAAGPNGKPGASARPEIAAGEPAPPSGGKDGSNTLPANIFVAAPPNAVRAGMVVGKPEPPRAPVLSPDNHGPAIHIPTSGQDRIESQVFGDRKYYSMALSMPNLTSSGSSWIIRFAEMNPAPGTIGDGLSAPVALSKVDPAYPAALIRDHVEGLVVLYAVIHSDGTVGDVRVLQGVQDDLDQNARIALQKWHFRPGTKNGAPVDIEAVIKIPFRTPRAAF